MGFDSIQAGQNWGPRTETRKFNDAIADKGWSGAFWGRIEELKLPPFNYKGNNPYQAARREYEEKLGWHDPPPKADDGKVDAKVFEGKEATSLEVVRWVSRNVMIKDVKAEDAPSADAWALMWWIQRSTAQANDFWLRIWPKTLPASTTETTKGFEDDGEVIDLIERVRKEAACGQVRVGQ